MQNGKQCYFCVRPVYEKWPNNRYTFGFSAIYDDGWKLNEMVVEPQFYGRVVDGEAYTYEIIEVGDGKTGVLECWKVSIYDGKELIQVLEHELAANCGHSHPSSRVVKEMDVDFDGDMDFILERGCYETGGNKYNCYLRDGDVFTLCPSFSDIYNPSIDEELQMIVSTLRHETKDHVYIRTYYQYNGSEFELIRQDECVYDYET